MAPSAATSSPSLLLLTLIRNRRFIHTCQSGRCKRIQGRIHLTMPKTHSYDTLDLPTTYYLHPVTTSLPTLTAYAYYGIPVYPPFLQVRIFVFLNDGCIQETSRQGPAQVAWTAQSLDGISTWQKAVNRHPPRNVDEYADDEAVRSHHITTLKGSEE